MKPNIGTTFRIPTNVFIQYEEPDLSLSYSLRDMPLSTLAGHDFRLCMTQGIIPNDSVFSAVYFVFDLLHQELTGAISTVRAPGLRASLEALQKFLTESHGLLSILGIIQKGRTLVETIGAQYATSPELQKDHPLLLKTMYLALQAIPFMANQEYDGFLAKMIKKLFMKVGAFTDLLDACTKASAALKAWLETPAASTSFSSSDSLPPPTPHEGLRDSSPSIVPGLLSGTTLFTPVQDTSPHPSITNSPDPIVVPALTSGSSNGPSR